MWFADDTVDNVGGQDRKIIWPKETCDPVTLKSHLTFQAKVYLIFGMAVFKLIAVFIDQGYRMLKPDMQFLLFAWIPTLVLTIAFEDISLFLPRLMGLV